MSAVPASEQEKALPLGRAARTGLSRGFGALSIRNDRAYWIGLILTNSGSWMQQVSLPWLILALGGSPIQLGTVAALQYAPAFFLAPLGGVLADRTDKRHALIAAHTAGLVQVGLLFVLALTGHVSVPVVMLMALWLGLVNGVEMPMRHSFAPDLALMLGGCATFAVGLAAMALIDSFLFVLPIVFVLGMCWMLAMNTVNATIQANVTDALRGRVMALYITVFVGCAAVGGILAGALAEAFGTPTTFMICAGLTLGVVVLVTLRLRTGHRRGALGVTHVDA